MIKIREEILYKVIDASELERFINNNLDFLDNEWQICDHEEWCRDSQHSFIITGYIDDDIIKEIESQDCLSTRNIFEYLCYLGKLEKGNYLIDYSW